MALNDVWRISITGSVGTSTGMCGAHFRLKAATPEPTNAALATVASDFMQVFRPVQTTPWAWRTWKAVEVRSNRVSYTTRPCLPTGGRGEEGIFTTNNGGTSLGSATLPHQCALVTTLKTQLIGRARRGRVFCPGLPEEMQTDGLWSSAAITAITTAWATFMTKYGFSPAGTDPLFEYGVWSMKIATGCVPNPNPPYGMMNTGAANPDDAFTGITTVVPRQTVYTQRRRVAGVGI